MTIFDEKTLRKLDRLTLIATRVRAGVMKGERRSTKRGTSIEFADYRNYVRGDDIRRIDWNVFARLDKPFIKLLEEEEDLAVHVLLDTSRSMNWPDGSLGENDPEQTNKFIYAVRLAAALSYIALTAGDRLTVSTLPVDARYVEQFGPSRGRGHTMRLLTFLAGLESEGVTDLNDALRGYARRARRPGLALIISDLFSPAGYQDGIGELQGRGYEVAVLHVMSPDELDPPLAGDLRLLDVETGMPQDVSLDAGLLNLYTRRVEAWREEHATYFNKRGVHYVPVTTDLAWEELVLTQLRRRQLVK